MIFAKMKKYSSLEDRYCFVPIAVETFGNFRRNRKEASGKNRSRLPSSDPALQRGNAASKLGTIFRTVVKN